MPWLIQSVRCSVCKAHHDFCTADMPDGSKRYTYTCPKDVVGHVITFSQPRHYGKAVSARPADAIEASEVH